MPAAVEESCSQSSGEQGQVSLKPTSRIRQWVLRTDRKLSAQSTGGDGVTRSRHSGRAFCPPNWPHHPSTIPT